MTLNALGSLCSRFQTSYSSTFNNPLAFRASDNSLPFQFVTIIDNIRDKGEIMKIVEHIKTELKKLPLGQPFTAALFSRYGTNANIRQILKRLVESGEIIKVSRGIFARTKQAPFVGVVMPSPQQITKLISQSTGEQIAPTGAEAANMMELSTQIPMRAVYLTTGHSRNIKIGNNEITLKHVSSKKLIKPGTKAGLVITAFWYLGKNNVTPKVIEKIKHKLSPSEFEELMECTPSMPHWMANALYHHQKGHH